MAYKELVSLDTDLVISLGGVDGESGKKNPTELEGFYLGFKEVPSKKSKTGLSKIHIFQTSKGNIGLWGKTDTDRQLATGSVGLMTKVTYLNKVTLPNGNPMHKFKIAQDPDNKIEVGSLPTGASNSNLSYAAPDAEEDDNFGYGNDSDDSSDDNDNQPFAQEEVVQNNAVAALERKKQVEALLKNKGKR